MKKTTSKPYSYKVKRKKVYVKKRRKLEFFLILIILFGIVSLLKNDKKNSIIPEKYRDIVLKSSEKYQIPVEILYGVIKTESNFDENATSIAGACGLMQLMPETFSWLQTTRGESLEDSLIYDPKINIDYGSSYLAMLYERFENWDTVFAAYNAGPTIVSVWLESSEDNTLKNIPYDETDNYVKKVNLAIQEYRKK